MISCAADAIELPFSSIYVVATVYRIVYAFYRLLAIPSASRYIDYFHSNRCHVSYCTFARSYAVIVVCWCHLRVQNVNRELIQCKRTTHSKFVSLTSVLCVVRGGSRYVLMVWFVRTYETYQLLVILLVFCRM